jgi:ATP-dependent protease HslVU (ClpYQ) peptidase subunit
MDWAEAGFAEKKRPKFVSTPDKDDEAALLMVTKKGIFYMLASDPYPELVDTNFFAIGSGGKVALGALHAGATLEEAMEIAHRVDPYTRPPFDILTLKEKP